MADRKAILVIGDWAIDEYWHLAQHESRKSSFPGQRHFRIGSEPKTPIYALCGAGQVTKEIHGLKGRSNKTPDFDLIAFGLWHEDDTLELLNHVAPPDHPRAVNKMISGGRHHLIDEVEGVMLQTLQPQWSTTRIIRFYERLGNELEQLGRVDWYALDELTRERITESMRYFDGINAAAVEAIIIDDMAKGVISRRIVREIARKYPDANWLVRSKRDEQLWLSELHESGNLLLNLIGPERTAAANPLGRWTVNRQATFEALNYLRMQPGKIKCAVTSRHEVILQSNVSEAHIVGGAGQQKILPTQLGWSTSFFAGLAYEIITNKFLAEPERRPVIEERSTIKNILRGANNAARVPRVAATVPDEPNIIEWAVVGNWKSTYENWKGARTKRGLIGTEEDPDTKTNLELSRAKTLFEDYALCVQAKIELINRIANVLAEFRRIRRPAGSRGIMINADPGSGKSSLVRSLASALDYRLVQYNITQMLSREDLLYLFDDVANQQANGLDPRPIIVFVDEINALLGGDNVFSAFLAPLEDGVYLRGGTRVSLQPCVWFFVGTVVGTQSDPITERIDKFNDFLSRLTLIERMDYAYLRSRCPSAAEELKLQAEARLEQVYLGASLIKQKYPDVQSVQAQVLDSFYDLDPSQAPARTIRARIRSLINVQGKKVKRKNCVSSPDWDGVIWNDKENLIRLYK